MDSKEEEAPLVISRISQINFSWSCRARVYQRKRENQHLHFLSILLHLLYTAFTCSLVDIKPSNPKAILGFCSLGDTEGINQRNMSERVDIRSYDKGKSGLACGCILVRRRWAAFRTLPFIHRYKIQHQHLASTFEKIHHVIWFNHPYGFLCCNRPFLFTKSIDKNHM